MFLLQETYHSDTSEDEDWTATVTPSRKKKGNATPVSPNGNASNNSMHTPKRNGHQNKFENTKNSPAKSHGDVKFDSREQTSRSPGGHRLGEAVVQVMHYHLNLVFKFNFCLENLSFQFLICILT